MINVVNSNLFLQIRAVWEILSPKRRKALVVLQLLGFVSAALEVANLATLLPLLRFLSNPADSLNTIPFASFLIERSSRQALIIILGFGFIFFVVASTIFRILTLKVQLRLSSLIASDLGERIFAAALFKPFLWHIQTNTSSIIGNLTKDVDQVYGSINGLLSIGVNAVIVLLLVASLLIISPVLIMLFIFLFILYYAILYKFTRSSLQRDGMIVTTNYEKSLQLTQEALGGIREVILDGSHSFFINEYRESNKRYRLATASVNLKFLSSRYLVEGFILFIVIGVSLVYELLGLGLASQLPAIATLSLGFYRLVQPMNLIFNAIGSLPSNQASFDRLLPLLNSSESKNNFQPTIKYEHPNQSRSNLPSYQPLIQLNHVSFRYNETAPWVLHDLNFSIKCGERLAIVGISGSGKSTCSDLLLGLLPPTIGLVYVEGENLHKDSKTLRDWQRRIAHVPQHIFISDASFASNIAFGIPEELINLDLVKHAAEQASISNLIENSSHGYSTFLGERGIHISGGQRQRIGIARALYKRPNLLVLDEATSALDSATESEVVSSLDSVDSTTTILIIAHRFSTIRKCDRILLFENGTITAEGHYQHMLSVSPTFKRLARSGSN